MQDILLKCALFEKHRNLIFFYLQSIGLDGRQDSWIHTIRSMEFDLRIVGVGPGGILSVSGKK